MLASGRFTGLAAGELVVSQVSRGVRGLTEAALASAPPLRALHVLGGFDGAGNELGSVTRFDPEANAWAD